MASDVEFVGFVVDQMSAAGSVSSRRMFGEYCLYCDGKVIGLVCDDQLFMKPTQAGRAYIGDVVEAPAYQGAKPSFLVGERVEDADWLAGLVRASLPELPTPRPKKPRAKKK
jgi:TfoX/Sxy family transcriptional regulator of competence genes